MLTPNQICSFIIIIIFFIYSIKTNDPIVINWGDFYSLKLFDTNINNTEICNLFNLQHFYYSNNPIEYINPQIIRFLNRNKHTQKIYNDTQSVHNHNIQKCITESIQYIMSNKPTLNADNLNELILNNKILTEQTKNILFEYNSDETIHSTLNITFKELLLNVCSLVQQNSHNDEIFAIMNIEMNDTLCKCFTGRISRLVNCLNGFDTNIKINISDNELIGNIIILIKNIDPFFKYINL